MGRLFAITDIHGCATALRRLLAELQPGREDTIVFLGDAIDRGPDSCGVLDQMLELDQQCRLVPILGNHEQMLLDSLDGAMPIYDWLIHGGREALDSYGKNTPLEAVPDEHVDFIKSWGDVFETETHLFAHGNYLPNKPLDDQPWDNLRWQSLKYYCPEPHESGKCAVLGHTSNKQGMVVDLGHLICIDTYCHGGGWLTALEPATGKLWQTNEREQLRNSTLYTSESTQKSVD